jgi:hypothetical protein
MGRIIGAAGASLLAKGFEALQNRAGTQTHATWRAMLAHKIRHAI